jgi:phospholipid-binding lipoprotein MlaA
MPVTEPILWSGAIRNWFSMLTLCVLLGGCASLDSNQNEAADPDAPSGQLLNADPFESFNRDVYAFNVDFDKAIGKPVAHTYVKYTPAPVRRSVTNFYNNLWEPNSIINALLQGKVHKAVSSTVRFVINSTVGILGLFDVALKLDVPRQEEDLGQTLAVWGVKGGPYLMLPFLGPSNVRDATSLAIQWLNTDLVPILFEGTEWVVVGGIRLVDARASVLGLEEALQFQVDPYVFLRESYRQSRLVQINDGAAPLEAEEDPFEDALFGE